MKQLWKQPERPPEAEKTNFTLSAEEQLREILAGTESLLPMEGFMESLKQSVSSGRPLRVKLGADPSRPDLHLGHAVILRKLRVLQDFGHWVDFVIGDFTGRIGDPTGKQKTRPTLTEADIQLHAQTYEAQIFKILNPKRTSIHRNSTWLSSLTLTQLLGVFSGLTVQQMSQREDFAARMKAGSPIALHEFLYPVLQGLDSVALRSDLELGGTDQTFNLFMGRVLQKQFGQAPQCILTMGILEGLDGAQKMSKSLGNAIGLLDEDMFGQLMSLPDRLIPRYFSLLGLMPIQELGTYLQDLEEGKVHPMEAKKRMACFIVGLFGGNGEEERQKFERRFSERSNQGWELDTALIWIEASLPLKWPELLLKAKVVTSKGEARRLIQQRAVQMGEKTILELETKGSVGTYLVQVGKLRRFGLKIIQ
jgi:tyrosyl-tRNA synthetase